MQQKNSKMMTVLVTRKLKLCKCIFEHIMKRDWKEYLKTVFLRDVSYFNAILLTIYHYSDVIMCAMASQITSLTIVYSIVYSCADHRKHQSSASLAFMHGYYSVTGEFPAQMASNSGNVSISWRHHVAYWPHLQNETLDSTAVSMAAICVLLCYYKSVVVRLGVSIVRRLI